MPRKVEPTLLHINKQTETSPGNWIYEIRTVAPHNPAGTIGRQIARLNDHCEPLQYAHLFTNAFTMLAKLRTIRDAANGEQLIQAQLDVTGYLAEFEKEMRKLE